MKTEDPFLPNQNDASMAGRIGPRLCWVVLAGLVVAAFFPKHFWMPFGNGHSRPQVDHELEGPVEFGWLATYRSGGKRMPRVAGISFSRDGGSLFVTGVGDSGAGFVGRTAAYDVATGRPRWTADLEVRNHVWASGGLQVCPGAERLYVTARTGEHAEVIAYGTGDGEVLWEFSLSPRHQMKPVRLAASGCGEFLYYATEPPSAEGNGILTGAVRAATGDRVWETSRILNTDTIPEQIVLAVPSDDTTLYAAALLVENETSARWRVARYEAASGAEVWSTSHSLDSRFGAHNFRMMLLGDRIYLAGTDSIPGGQSTGNAVLCLDSRTGDPLWSRVDRENFHELEHTAALEAPKGILLAGHQRQGRHESVRIGLLSPEHGELGWLREVPELARLHSALVMPSEAVVILAGIRAEPGRQPVVLAIELRTGRVAWMACYSIPGATGAVGRRINSSPDGMSLAISGVTNLRGEGVWSTALLRHQVSREEEAAVNGRID